MRLPPPVPAAPSPESEITKIGRGGAAAEPDTGGRLHGIIEAVPWPVLPFGKGNPDDPMIPVEELIQDASVRPADEGFRREEVPAVQVLPERKIEPQHLSIEQKRCVRERVPEIDLDH